MEAAWLAVAILTPVFFNIYSSRIFEPDKITLLRTLALVSLAAWLVKLIEEGGFRWERIPQGDNRFKALLRVPLVPLAVALCLVYLISTIFSVTPYTSLWGSYQRPARHLFNLLLRCDLCCAGAQPAPPCPG